MERLWEVEREQGSTTLRAATLERLGGAAQIVAAHLERAMDALTPAQQEIASALFRQLVTPSGAKIAHAASDLAGYAGVPEDEALGVLEALAARRILRPGDNGSYEIYHDVLAAPILAWRARYVHARGARRRPPAQPPARARRRRRGRRSRDHGADRGVRARAAQQRPRRRARRPRARARRRGACRCCPPIPSWGSCSRSDPRCSRRRRRPRTSCGRRSPARASERS